MTGFDLCCVCACVDSPISFEYETIIFDWNGVTMWSVNYIFSDSNSLPDLLVCHLCCVCHCCRSRLDSYHGTCEHCTSIDHPRKISVGTRTINDRWATISHWTYIWRERERHWHNHKITFNGTDLHRYSFSSFSFIGCLYNLPPNGTLLSIDRSLAPLKSRILSLFLSHSLPFRSLACRLCWDLTLDTIDLYTPKRSNE